MMGTCFLFAVSIAENNFSISVSMPIAVPVVVFTEGSWKIQIELHQFRKT